MAQQDYDLTCWYLNQRRVVELVGSNVLTTTEIQRVASLGDAFYLRHAVLAAEKDALINWMQNYKPLTLGQLLLREKALPGTLFTHYSNFYGRSTAPQGKTRRRNTEKVSPYIHCKLEGLGHDVHLRLPYDPVHLTAQTSQTMLSGHHQIFVLAAIDSEQDGVLSAFPYIIASLLPMNPEQSLRTSSKGHLWKGYLEITIDQIDSFSLVRDEPPPVRDDLELLRSIPEKEIKLALAEIIGEPTVPKDWGGEHSDLFTDYLTFDGKRISTAIALKGPAKFAPMTMADLGKNGDQIYRLFAEPAQLLILQHCHVITPSVRATMRAFATQIDNPRLFALINGYDTLRLLRAYRKCNFAPTEIPNTRYQRTGSRVEDSVSDIFGDDDEAKEKGE